jgi:hypothetical protein
MGEPRTYKKHLSESDRRYGPPRGRPEVSFFSTGRFAFVYGMISLPHG